MKLKIKTPIFNEDEIVDYDVVELKVTYKWSSTQESYIFTINNNRMEEVCHLDAFLSRARNCKSEIIFETKKEKADFLSELKRLWRQEEFLLKLYNYFIYKYEPGAAGR